ncbi:MAG TPA: ABC transporter permease [Puia sp.]|nr:ABC transporter permease [Puia sp.]
MKFANQLRATLTLSKYSLLATLRSPTSVVFSILFPVIFIVVFGSMVGDRAITLKLALAPGCDTTNLIFKALENATSIALDRSLPGTGQADALKKGRITAILDIRADGGISPFPHYHITLRTGGAAPESINLLETILHESVRKIDERLFPRNPSVAAFEVIKESGKTYRQIDFILPGQLGFSLLMAGVFGSSFLLFSLRQGLVLKRLRATPIRKRTIIGGEMLSRLLFHIIGFIIMVLLGYYCFQFTLINGVFTFFEMLLFSLFGLGIFMGIGFVISGVLQNESSITPVANTITLPQILLCGLFFPITSYPHWLQGFCNLLPLTFFVDGLRKIAFEGDHIWQMPRQLIGLLIWTAVISFWSVRAFKWE